MKKNQGKKENCIWFRYPAVYELKLQLNQRKQNYEKEPN